MSLKRKIATIIFLSLTGLVTLTIFVNALLPGNISSSLSTSFSDAVIRVFINPENDEEFYYFVRKTFGHFLLNGINAGLALMTFFTYFKDKREHRGYLILPAFMYGITVAGISELLQLLAEERGPSWSDVGINTLGCATFVFIIGLAYSIKFMVKREK